ncbi:MAG: class I SAM-dependent methyltransferase [Gammaproteobacteria bacterium]|nr:class I SAM-dependent methyltransferase [Gammaproteobacteria bacterium]
MENNMGISEAIYKRGKTAGVFPSLSSRRDEAYMNFIEDARNLLLHAQQKPIGEYSKLLLKNAGKSMEPDIRSTEEAIDLLMNDNVLKTYYRIKRTLQESFWECTYNSLNMRKNDLLEALDDAEKIGPGTVTYDPEFSIPKYATSEIHIQPGGNVNEPLSGLLYDYGSKVFMGGAADNDMFADMQASSIGTPQNGEVNRILDLGCSAGVTTSALKRIYPDAEVYGIDVSSHMVRYAHARALEQDYDINFMQMLAEDLDFDNHHFDIVVANLLFHEVPVSISKKILSETLRVLRPGGSFTLIDFPGDKTRDVYTMFFGAMDAADNNEPFLPGFVRSNVEEIMEDIGFEMSPYDPNKFILAARIGFKPNN